MMLKEAYRPNKQDLEDGW